MSLQILVYTLTLNTSLCVRCYYLHSTDEEGASQVVVQCDESTCNAGDMGSIPGLGRIPWRRTYQPTPVFLPGKFHGQRSLVGNSPWGRKESDTTEHTCACVPVSAPTNVYTHTDEETEPRGNLPKITGWVGGGRFESHQSGSIVHALN